VEIRLQGRDGAPVVERLRDPAAPHAEDDLVHRESLRRMRSAVARLSAQERCVLDHRFGLGGEEPRTLQETGVHLQLSRERVRQVEQQAIARLKRALDPRYPRPHVRTAAAAPACPPAPDLAL
jgi:RNA polymerase sigma factor (sigma-70 family)